jgi:hypothetical protein
MRFRTGRGVRLLALVAVAIAVTAGGVAYATIPDGNVIHGCYQKSNGTLRVVDTGAGGACSSQEKSLDFSQMGPSGPSGASGPSGPPGPSDAWQGSNPYTPGVQQNTATFVSEWTLTTMTSVSLPAGSFFVSAKTSLVDTGEAVNLYCTLNTSGSVFDDSFFYARTDEYTPTMLEAVITLGSPASVALSCGSTGAATSGISSKVDAIKVGTVH